MTDGAIHTVRDLSRLLHPALLDDLGLPAAVGAYLDAFGQRHRITVELLQDRMDDRLSPEVEASIYRIFQEALTNVARHSEATLVRVYLQRLPTSMLMTVEDNGVGFDPANAPDAGHGFGLIGMRERVTLLGGKFQAGHHPSVGYSVRAHLPLDGTPA